MPRKVFVHMCWERLSEPRVTHTKHHTMGRPCTATGRQSLSAAKVAAAVLLAAVAATAGFPQHACTKNCAAQPTTCGAAEQMMAHFGCANACSNRFKNNVRKYLECGDTTAQPTTTGTGTGTGTGTDTGTTAGSSVQCTSQCAPRVRGRRGLRL